MAYSQKQRNEYWEGVKVEYPFHAETPLPKYKTNTDHVTVKRDSLSRLWGFKTREDRDRFANSHPNVRII
jgi:hypothetical protein